MSFTFLLGSRYDNEELKNALKEDVFNIVKKDSVNVACGQGVRLIVEGGFLTENNQAEFVIFSNGRETNKFVGSQWAPWSDFRGIAQTFVFAG